MQQFSASSLIAIAMTAVAAVTEVLVAHDIARHATSAVITIYITEHQHHDLLNMYKISM